METIRNDNGDLKTSATEDVKISVIVDEDSKVSWKITYIPYSFDVWYDSLKCLSVMATYISYK